MSGLDLRIERLRAGLTASELALCYRRAGDGKPCSVQMICDIESQRDVNEDVLRRYEQALASAIQAREAAA
jgi:hypothetical protein